MRFLVTLASVVLTGCMDAGGVSMTELAAPHITEVYPTTVRSGVQTEIYAKGLGSPAAHVVWMFGGGCYPDQVDYESAITTPQAPGTYQCSVYSSNSMGKSTYTFTLTVTGPGV